MILLSLFLVDTLARINDIKPLVQSTASCHIGDFIFTIPIPLEIGAKLIHQGTATIIKLKVITDAVLINPKNDTFLVNNKNKQ